VRVTASVTSERGRLMTTEGRVYDAEGSVAAEATARFVKV
jgi:acyl-coenzyme A thioesterase PaaI-like protein